MNSRADGSNFVSGSPAIKTVIMPAGQHVLYNTEFNGVPTDPFYVFSVKFIDITEDGVANFIAMANSMVITVAHNIINSSGMTSSAPIEGQIYRGLMQSEAGLEHRLQRLPPQVFEEFYLQHNEGRSAREEGNWERAILSYLKCKTLLEVEKVNVEEEAYKWLLAWVDLSLAHLYQLQGSADSMSNSDKCDILEKAFRIRMEILDCVIPFANLHPQLVKVCKSYCYTAQYEWGSLTSSEAKMEAIQEYAKLMGCDKYEAEPQLCLLLYVDHYYAGSFEVGLLWIQEANRLWKELDSQDWRGYPPYCLECEAELLIKLEKFPEAVKALEDLPYTKDYTHEKHPKFAVKVYDWLQECYTQMSRRASENGNAEQAECYEQSAQLQHALKYSLSYDAVQENVFAGEFSLPFTGIPPSHPIMMQTPFPLGSWLGLVLSNDYVADLYLKKLPAPIQCFMRYHCRGAQAAQERGDWAGAISEYQMARGFLKITEKLVDKGIHCWLLAWVDIPLANLYHYRAKMFKKAVEIWREMLNCEVRQFPSDFFSSGFRIPITAACFESCTSVGKPATEFQEYGDQNAHILCFWLYFGNYNHGLFDASLKWLREAKRIDEQHFPDRMCSIDFQFFCCEYDYLRCEADLLMKLKKFEEAECILRKLLETRHVLAGSPRLAREARQWLKSCYIQVRRCSASADDEEIADLERALELSELTVENHQQEGTADQSPSPTGCIFIAKTQDLVQSETGLEQHLLKLPVPIRLAFRNCSQIGLSQQRYGGWDSAIFHFESCRELLKISRTEIQKTCHDWLLVWADLPLAQLYEFKKVQFKKALDIWREIYVSAKDKHVGTSTMVTIIYGLLTAAYQCVVHDYPDLKDLVVKNIMQCTVGAWFSEVDLLAFLSRRYFKSRNFEVSLDCAREGKRLLKEIFPGNENDKKEREIEFFNLEALCLIKLGRHEDAKRIMDDYGEGCDDAQNEILEALRDLCFRRVGIREEEALMETSNLPPLLRQTLDSFSLGEEKKYEEAVMSYDTYLKRIADHRNDSRGSDTTVDGAFGFYDSFRLGKLNKKEYFQCMDMYIRSISYSGAELRAPRQDANFLRAKQHFENCIELSLPLKEPNKIALMNRHLGDLYACFEYAYSRYLLHLMIQAAAALSAGVSRGIRHSNADPLMHQALIDVTSEIAAYLELTRGVSSEMYVSRALVVYANFLYTRKKYTENIVNDLESQKHLYTYLQDYYRKRADMHCHLAKFTGAFEEEVQKCRWKAFLYSERERTRAMLYQLGSSRLSYGGSRELWGFDAHDDIALEVIQDYCATLSKEGTVFVQFSYTHNGKDFITYVIDQKGKLSVTVPEIPQNGSKRSIKKILKNLHDYFQRGESVRKRRHGYNEDTMNEDLEYLYDVLMRPIAHHLENMKPEHKLILAPRELLTKVPFAALRDRDQPAHKKYLIERHTIAFTFSLRVLERCSERLQELKSIPLASHGSIIALGNPEYRGYHKPLEESGNEVIYIKSLFADKSEVVTLLKENATAKQLLYWAGKPSHESYRQAIIHIGAHGEVNEEDHMKSVIRLARPARLAGDDAPTKETTSSRGKQVVAEEEDDDHEEDEDDDTDDDEMGIVDKAETSIKSSYMSPLTRAGMVMDNSVQNWEAALPKESLRADCSSNQRNDSICDLNAEDITDAEGIQWGAELVVLSACRTSQGKLSAEGVLSLARAFMIAGVPCVVASQWEVLDDATCELMKSFYKDLRGGKDVASALRSSMLKMLKVNGCGVRKWAPFGVWGVPTLCIPSHLQ